MKSNNKVIYITFDADVSEHLVEECAKAIKNLLKKDTRSVKFLSGQTTDISKGIVLHSLKSG